MTGATRTRSEGVCISVIEWRRVSASRSPLPPPSNITPTRRCARLWRATRAYPSSRGLFNPRRGIHASTVVPSLIAYDVDSLSKIRLDYERDRREEKYLLELTPSSRLGCSDIRIFITKYLFDPRANRNLYKSYNFGNLTSSTMRRSRVLRIY